MEISVAYTAINEILDSVLPRQSDLRDGDFYMLVNL